MSEEVPPGYEEFWTNAGLNRPRLPYSQSGKANSPQSARVANPEVSDGRVSVALDSGLLELIENITQELSRTTTGATGLPEMGNDSSSRSSTMAPMTSSGLPPRSTSLNDRMFVGTQHGVPPRSSTGQAPRLNFLAALGTTFEEETVPQVTFPPLAPMRSGKLNPGSLARLASARTESTGSRTLSGQSEVDPLPQVLHALDDEPDECIVVVRRITRLGFKSNRILKSRFEQMGWDVRNVVLLPSRSRPADGSPGGNAPHARPSSMGFVVFTRPQQAKECLSLGSIDVEGIQVLVQPFTRQYKPTNAKETS
jgi:hypothetical protein